MVGLSAEQKRQLRLASANVGHLNGCRIPDFGSQAPGQEHASADLVNAVRMAFEPGFLSAIARAKIAAATQQTTITH